LQKDGVLDRQYEADLREKEANDQKIVKGKVRFEIDEISEINPVFG